MGLFLQPIKQTVQKKAIVLPGATASLKLRNGVRQRGAEFVLLRLQAEGSARVSSAEDTGLPFSFSNVKNTKGMKYHSPQHG